MGGAFLQLLYDKSLVKKPAESWDELERQIGYFRSAGKRPISFNLRSLFLFYSFLFSFDVSFYDKEGPTLDSPEMREALRSFRQVLNAHKEELQCSREIFIDALYEQHSGYAIRSSGIFKDYELRLGARLGTAPLPAFGERPMKSVAVYFVLVFPDHSLSGPKQESIKAFARFLQSEAVQLQQYPLLGMLPVNRAALQKMEQKGCELQKLYIQQSREAILIPTDPMMRFSRFGIRKGLELFLTGAATEEQTAKFMQKKALLELSRAKEREN